MSAAGVRLGIDFGTSNTVAVVALPGREPRPLLFDGSPLLPSAVCLDPAARLLVGRDALHTSLASPASFEPFPKRCIDDETVLLGETQVPVPDLIAAALRRVAAEVAVIASDPVTEVVLTCPAAWGARRRDVLLAAAAQALPGTVRLVTEPVAAAGFFVDAAGGQVPVGHCAVVYDFGAGTFDASVLRRTATGFTTVAAEGLPDAGGLDIDAAIVARLGETVGAQDAALWQRLVHPETTGDRRASRQLWDNARAGKEMLSRATTTLIHVPLLDADAPLGREELEQIAGPVLERTVEAVRLVLQRAGIEAHEIAAVFLAGGSSRIPAVATFLHRALGIAPTNVEQPELAVAEGSLRTVESVPEEEPTTSAAAWPPILPVAAPARPRRRPAVILTLGATAVVFAAAGVAAAALGDDGQQKQGASPTTPAAASPSPTPSPTPPFAPSLDPCAVGTWRSTSITSFHTINGDRVALTGRAGAIMTYRPDGTATADFNKSTEKVANHDGARWTELVRGTATFRVRHTGGKEYISDIRAKGTATLYRNGKRDNQIPLAFVPGPEEYFCSADRLEFHGAGTSVWTRVR
ncbi:Hsp70 family protein [Micromonospora sp. CPCC 206061]|uniref:Hsp70 family protein n=1 Tax=Micromonospora sp. CPCC 206061 TaxID=3122410 RepID=UPI002FF0EC2A